MRFTGTLIAGFAGIVIGWYLHGILDPAQEPVKKPHSLERQKSHDLGHYQILGDSQSRSPEIQHEKDITFADELRALLQKGDYEEAIVRYNRQLNMLSKQESDQSRQQILQQARILLHSGQYNGALALLDEYLGVEFRDVDALLIKAEVLNRKKAQRQQIAVLYDAKSYAYQQQEISDIENQIRDSVSRYRKWLVENKRHTELLDLFQELVYLEPDYSPYFIELAKAQRANRYIQDARQSLELVMSDPTVGEQARQLLAEINNSRTSEFRDIAQVDQSRGIPLYRRGSHFVVEATLNGYTPLRLIIDTGASLTVIKTDRLRAAFGGNLSQFPVHNFNTANGVVKAPVLSVDSLSIGEYEVTNLQIGGLDLVNTADVDGLLGMNFLKHYRFFIDQQNNLLRLSLNTGH